MDKTAKTKIKEYIALTRQWAKAFVNWCDSHPFIFITLLSLVMAFVVEAFTRRSLWEGIKFLITYPHFFLLNALILFFLYSLSLLFKRRYSYILFFLLSVGLAVANYITTKYRVTPISLSDILILPSVLSIIDIYLSVFQLVVIGILIAIGISIVVLAIIRQKRRQVSWLKTSIVAAVSTALTVSLLVFSTYSKAIANDYSFIGNGYDKYGFIYSFCLSAIDRGKKKPDTYSKE